MLFALTFTYLGECFEFISPPTAGEYFVSQEIIEQFSAIKKTLAVKLAKALIR